MAAAAARKLAKEIDITLKKVDDGKEEFDRYFEEAVEATSQRDKDRLGEELKKCINRQQRLRVQIREWLAQIPEGKERQRLESSRKDIENDMTRFKQLERDFKTKAYSTSALRQGDSMDLEDVEKMKYQQWLDDTINTLQNQVDEFDVDIETANDTSEQETMMEYQKKHRWHIGKLEQLLRGLINDDIATSDLAFVKESLEVYMEMYADPDYYHDDDIYEGFDLADPDASNVVAAPPVDSADEAPAEATPVANDKTKRGKQKDNKKNKKEVDKKAAAPVATQGPAVSVAAAKAAAAAQKAADSSGEKSPSNSSRGQPGTPKGSGEPEQSEDPEEVKIQEDQLLMEAEEFVCKICYVHVVSAGPVLTTCAHLFCGDCFNCWLKQHPESQSWAQRAKQGPDRMVPCPVCKKSLNVKTDLHPVGNSTRSENLLLWRVLSSLKIMCCNNPKVTPGGNCDWVGEYGTFQKHIQECSNKPLGSGASNSGATASQPSRTNAPAPEPAAPTIPKPVEPARIIPPPSSHDPKTTFENKVDNSSSSRQQSQQKVNNAPATPQAQMSQHMNPEDYDPAIYQAKLSEETIPQVQHLGLKVAAFALEESSLEARQAAPLPNGYPQVDSSAPSRQQKVNNAPATPQAAPLLNGNPPAGEESSDSSTTASSQTRSPLKEQPVVNDRSREQTNSTTTGRSELAKRAEPAKPSEAEPVAAPSRPEVVPPPKGKALPVVHAVQPFIPSATETRMLQVKVGDRLQVHERHESGWAFCRKVDAVDNTSGWIPLWVLPVEKEDPMPAPVVAAPEPKAEVVAPPKVLKKVLTAFSAKDSSQLSLRPDEFVEVINRHDSGWTFGRQTSGACSEGWFPDWACEQ